MSETTNNIQTDGNGNIMRELSIIKAAVAVQTSETINIVKNIDEIKSVIKEIQIGYVNQAQHQTLVKCAEDHEERLRSNETNVTRIMTFGTGLILLIGVIEFVLNKYF